MGSIYAAGSSNLLASRWARSSSCSSVSSSELSHLCFSLSLTWNLSSIKRVFCCCVCAACRLFHRTTRTKVSNILFLPTEELVLMPFIVWCCGWLQCHGNDGCYINRCFCHFQRYCSLLYRHHSFKNNIMSHISSAILSHLQEPCSCVFFPSRLLNAIIVHQSPGWRMLILTQHLFEEHSRCCSRFLSVCEIESHLALKVYDQHIDKVWVSQDMELWAGPCQPLFVSVWTMKV